MSANTRPTLPPNPYSRQPIRKREQLAGRERELRALRYYLSLTAASQSPHVALIGQRGVGKTSLLNGTEALAVELKLLPVRLDMNEQKVRSPGEFWHDLYVTLILALAKAGCWGGLQGSIYIDLFKMMHSKQQPSSADRIVLQTPFAFSCHQGELATFVCSDALVAHDFNTSMEELKHKGFVGIVLLIDEADCIGQNVPLLQMFRNIFQIVESCSLILAGTESVFPAISDVFSPVPRQFHRIDVKPFTDWVDTRQLVFKPLSQEQADAIAPNMRVIEDLHDLCGGDPSEVQLYCHHMYRIVEDGTSSRMALVPQVFREVLREYRSSTPANFETVINAIERLPDKYLFDSRWLSRRKLSLQENIRVEILQRELGAGSIFSVDERSAIAKELKAGYDALINEGIIESESSIHLRGAPLTASYWKSYVEAEKGKRWTWDDDICSEFLRKSLMRALGKNQQAVSHILLETGDKSVHAIESLRKGERILDLEKGFSGLMVTLLMAKEDDIEKNALFAIDAEFQIESPVGRQTCGCRFLESRGKPIQKEAISQWIDSQRDLLASNEIVLSLSTFVRWALPTPEEFHRLAWVTGTKLPEKLFGPSEIDRAFQAFGSGDIENCANILSRLLNDKEEPQTANNLGFCQIILGRVNDGLQNINRAIAKEYDPLYELNKGVALFLQGDSSSAKQSLSHAIEWIQDPKHKYACDRALYVLLLDRSQKRVVYVSDMPIDTAILINLWFIGGISKEELLDKLSLAYPDKHLAWIPIIEERS